MPHESSQPPPIGNGAPPNADDHDESLVRWFLSLTPAQRLDILNANINAILRARGSGPWLTFARSWRSSFAPASNLS